MITHGSHNTLLFFNSLPTYSALTGVIAPAMLGGLLMRCRGSGAPPLLIEPTHELLGVGVKGFSRELGSRKRGVGLSSWCDIVAEAVRSGPKGAPFTLPEVASRVCRSDSERWDGSQPWASAKCIASSVLSNRAWNDFVPRLLSRSSPKSNFINL